MQAGSVVEELFWLVEPAERGETIAPKAWMPFRNHLRHLPVGLKAALPNCYKITLDATTSTVMEHSKIGRDEVERELERLDAELRRLRSPDS